MSGKVPDDECPKLGKKYYDTPATHHTTIQQPSVIEKDTKASVLEGEPRVVVRDEPDCRAHEMEKFHQRSAAQEAHPQPPSDVKQEIRHLVDEVEDVVQHGASKVGQFIQHQAEGFKLPAAVGTGTGGIPPPSTYQTTQTTHHPEGIKTTTTQYEVKTSSPSLAGRPEKDFQEQVSSAAHQASAAADQMRAKTEEGLQYSKEKTAAQTSGLQSVIHSGEDAVKHGYEYAKDKMSKLVKTMEHGSPPDAEEQSREVQEFS